MGYRSDVRIIMSKNAYKEFEKYVKEHINNYKVKNIENGSITSMFNYDYNLINKLDIFKQANTKDKFYLGWNNLKWYNGYEDVDAIMDSLDKLQEKGYGYSFSRIGENYEDFEGKYVDVTDKDKIKYLDYPQVVRCFDDDNYIDLDIEKEKNKDMERR